MSHFYGTEYKILVGFRAVSKTEILTWVVNYATFEGTFYVFANNCFLFNFFFKYCVKKIVKHVFTPFLMTSFLFSSFFFLKILSLIM